MKTQHTPGPWHIDNRPDGSKEIQRGDCTPVAVMTHLSNRHANARLIASAPQLLEALEGILADVETANEKRTAADWDFACYHAANQARAAIAKAKGSND